MKAGFFEKEITPPVGIWLAGYGSRSRPSEGITDPLYLRILALEDDKQQKAAIVTADILKFPKDMSWRIKDWCERKLGLKSKAVIINSSHTHYAPVLAPQASYPHWPVDIKYGESLESSIKEGINTAFKNLERINIKFGTHKAHFAINRRLPDPNRKGKVTDMRPNEDGYYDPDMPLIIFEDPNNGRLKAIFYSYACHPTSQGADNNIGADYPGAIARGLKNRLGKNVITLFAQGAGGNAKPRFYKRDKPEFVAATPRQVNELGKTTAESISRFIKSGQMTGLQLSLKSSEREFEIPVDIKKIMPKKKLLSISEDEAAFFAHRIAARITLEKLRAKSPDRAFQMHLTKIALNSKVEIIGMSGEVTAEVGRMIKDLYKDKHIIFLGYCSYTDAYIPNAKMIVEGGYESVDSAMYHSRSAPFVKNIDKIIGKAVLSLK